MGTTQSEFKEIEDLAKNVVQQKTAATEETAKLHSELKRRESEYQSNLDRLLQNVEEQEKQLKALKKDLERQRQMTDDEKTKTQKAFALLNKEFKDNISTLRGQIQLIKPGVSDSDTGGGGGSTLYPSKLNVGLFGSVGVGKTSLLNSLKYAVQGDLEESEKEQVAPMNFQGSHTLMRYSVRITHHINFIDNRGIRPEDLLRSHATDELQRQLEGKSSFTKNVDWCASNQKTAEEEKKEKQIFSTILVFDARDPRAIGPHMKKFLEVLKEWQGQYPIAVITHVDVATPEQIQDTRSRLDEFGISVYEVANITNERKELEPKYQSCLLRLLERCIRHGERTILSRTEREYRNK